MERKHDVIVVGAGPAGAAAAAVLAQKGCDVLLLDRELFPRDKICGDAVPSGAIELLYRLGMKDKILAAQQREEFYPLQKMRLISTRGYEVKATFKKGLAGADSFVAPRKYLDAVIQQHAVDSGAEFRQAQVKAPIIETDQVVGVTAQTNGSTHQFKANVVIGADGVTSAIARALRPKNERHSDKHRAVALRAYIDDLETLPHEIEFYLYRKILPGYAWIFPTGDQQANIGLGMRLDHFRARKQDLNSMMEQFLAIPAVKKRLIHGGRLHDVATWQLNFGSQRNLQSAFAGAVLIGDAAGLVNPLTGGGIHNSLISAEIAANIIFEALQVGDYSKERLQPYQAACHHALWKSMKRSYRLQSSLLRFPFLVDLLVNRMGTNSRLTQIFLSKL